MKLTDLTTEIARRADTSPKGSAITATDVSRVVAVLFDVLAECPSSEAADVIAKGLTGAEKRKAGKGK